MRASANICLALAAAFCVARPGAAGGDIDRITGRVDDVGYSERLDLIHSLPEHLPPQTVESLLGFLTDPEDLALEEESNVFRNDVAAALLRSSASPGDVADALQNAWSDHRHSFVWRSYCLQYIGISLSRLDAPRARSARETLWKAASAPGTECAGTALIALLSNLDHGVDAQRLADRAFALAADPDARATAGLSAMQTLYELRDERAADLARELLTETRSVPLRLIALTSMGELGDAGDIQYIENYLNNPIPPLRRTAARARERFGERYPRGDS